jgi:hypothetical protein
MLSLLELRLVPRPADGACFFWSAGTAIGTYTVEDFHLVGNGQLTASPLAHRENPRSLALVERMMLDRARIGAWILDARNHHTLREEHELWDSGRLDGARVELHRSHAKEWATDAVIKAYAAVHGVDIAVITLDGDVIVHGCTLYDADTEEVSRAALWDVDVWPRIEAQRQAGWVPRPGRRKLILLRHSPGHFEVVLDVAPPHAPTPPAVAPPAVAPPAATQPPATEEPVAPPPSGSPFPIYVDAITQENAAQHPPPSVTDREAAAVWYLLLTGHVWDGTSGSYKNARKRYSRLLPQTKEREKAREERRDRSERVRPADDSQRRVRQRAEQDPVRVCIPRRRLILEQMLADRQLPAVLQGSAIHAGTQMWKLFTTAYTLDDLEWLHFVWECLHCCQAFIEDHNLRPRFNPHRASPNVDERLGSLVEEWHLSINDMVELRCEILAHFRETAFWDPARVLECSPQLQCIILEEFDLPWTKDWFIDWMCTPYDDIGENIIPYPQYSEPASVAQRFDDVVTHLRKHVPPSEETTSDSYLLSLSALSLSL